MSVSVGTGRSSIWSADGTNRNWDFPFKALRAEHLRLEVTDPAGVVSEASDSFTVIGLGDDNGGSVVYPIAPAAALPAGYKVQVVRRVPFSQPNRIGNQGGFHASTHENTFDLLAMQVQQINEEGTARDVRAPFDDGVIDMRLPHKANRAGKVLEFDESGRPGVSVSGSALLAASQAAVEARDLIEQMVDDVRLGALPTGALIDPLRFKETGSAAITRAVGLIFKDRPIPITAYGAVAGGPNCAAALTYALQAGGAENRMVEIPAGYWVFNSGVAFDNACPGIVGAHGRASVLVPSFLDAPLLTIVVPPGQAVGRKVFEKFGVQGSYALGSNYDGSRFLQVVGGGSVGGSGLSRSRFNNLIIEGVYAGIEIATDPIATVHGAESQSGWNIFEDIEFWSGARPLYYGILLTKGSSTGNTFSNLQGAPETAMLRFEGNGCVVGDIIYSGGHLGAGHLASFANNIIYNRSQQYVGVQVDAGSLGPFLFESGQAVAPTNIKVLGTIGGSSTWASTPPLRHSSIDDLGASRWAAGGAIVGAAAAATSGVQTADLWDVELGNFTSTKITVVVEGVVGGVDYGSTRRDFYISRAHGACRVDGDAEQYHTISGGTAIPNASWPRLSAVVNGEHVVVRMQFTPAAASALHTNIYAEGGAVRVLRVAGTVGL